MQLLLLRLVLISTLSEFVCSQFKRAGAKVNTDPGAGLRPKTTAIGYVTQLQAAAAAAAWLTIAQEYRYHYS